MRLFRPIGLGELKLIAKSGFTAFPPRLSHQPIFYPVLDLEYARQIARDWNARDEFSGYVGFVTEFDVSEAGVVRYPIQVAGASVHRELWVPADELPLFNSHIVAPIRVVEAYPGPKFAGSIDPSTRLPVDLFS
jgi:hypothetical protein